MKNLFTLLTYFICISTFSQVGIGTSTPSATLDIVAANPTGATTGVDGILIPRVERQRALNMLATPTSTIIYVNEVVTGSATGTAINITTVGLYYFDGTVWVKVGAAAAGSDWSLLGNTGTLPATNFLGTTDANDLSIRTNNIIKAKFTTKGQLGIFNTGNSVLIGDQAGNNDDLSANENSFIGYQSGLNTTTGSNNVALGAYSLKTHTTTANNTAIGFGAMENASTNGNTTAIGYRALRANTGADNTAVGFGALDVNTSGARNTALGSNALGAVTTGVDNTAVGKGALLTNTGDNNTAIGSQALDANTSGARNVAIGPNALGSSTTGNENIAIGADALVTATTNIQNIAIGYQSLRFASAIPGNTGSNNIAIGKTALEQLTLTDGNVAIGNFSMNSNPPGNYNTAIGYSSMLGIDGGNENVALGHNAGGGVDSGNRNISIGTDGLTNVGIGNDNIAVGYRSLYNIRAKDGNIGIGANTGFNNSNGSNCVFIGNSAGYNELGTDVLYLENSNSATPLIGGDFATDKVVINGTIASATHTLTVGGDVKIGTLMNLTPGSAPVTPAEGDVYYDSASKKVRVWTGAAWENLN